MAKKDELRNGSQSAADAMNKIANPDANENSADSTDSADSKNRPHTQNTKGTKYAKPGYYRFNLNMPIEYNDYLKTASYNASSPGHIVTITEYICELIRQDMEQANEKAAKQEAAKQGEKDNGGK